MRPMDEEFAESPGMACLVVREGRTMVRRAWGVANFGTGEHCGERTNFRLASVSKQFTAMAIVLLAAGGEVALDDPAAKYLPELDGSEITLRHLLAHRGGLQDYEELIPPGTTAQVHDRDVLELLRPVPLRFRPGSDFRYNNGGYALLALVVERVSGVSFAAYLRTFIFQPLGMEGTLAWESGIAEVPRRALGYSRVGEQFELTDQSVTSAVLGDGGIYSSIADLSRWLDAIDRMMLVELHWWKELFHVWSPFTDFPGSGYGLGWYVQPRGVWHYGATCGFSTWIEWRPQERAGVVLLTNRSGVKLAPIAETMLRQALSG